MTFVCVVVDDAFLVRSGNVMASDSGLIRV
jgi:hypothetical protein